jgi:hypothetical protein
MSKQWFVLVSVFLVSTIYAQREPVAAIAECKNIGFPDLPDGFIDLGGSVIGDHDGTEYGFAHVCRGKQHQVRLQRVVSRDKKGRTSWKDVDALLLPPLSSDELLVFGSWSTCRRGADPDPAIIAIVARTQEPEYKKIRIAWRANLESGKIAKIATTGIVCTNDSYGI